MAGQRPGGVTLVAVIAWINGAIGIIAGIVGLIGGQPVLNWAVTLAIGILTIAVSLGLFRGSNVARIIMAVVFALNLAVSIWAIFAGISVWAVAITGILSLIGLILLFTRRANEFFRS